MLEKAQKQILNLVAAKYPQVYLVGGRKPKTSLIFFIYPRTSNI